MAHGYSEITGLESRFDTSVSETDDGFEVQWKARPPIDENDLKVSLANVSLGDVELSVDVDAYELQDGRVVVPSSETAHSVLSALEANYRPYDHEF